MPEESYFLTLCCFRFAHCSVERPCWECHVCLALQGDIPKWWSHTGAHICGKKKEKKKKADSKAAVMPLVAGLGAEFLFRVLCELMPFLRDLERCAGKSRTLRAECAGCSVSLHATCSTANTCQGPMWASLNLACLVNACIDINKARWKGQEKRGSLLTHWQTWFSAVFKETWPCRPACVSAEASGLQRSATLW